MSADFKEVPFHVLPLNSPRARIPIGRRDEAQTNVSSASDSQGVRFNFSDQYAVITIPLRFYVSGPEFSTYENDTPRGSTILGASLNFINSIVGAGIIGK